LRRLKRDHLWDESLWGRNALVNLKTELDRNDIGKGKLRYKDAFLNAIK